MADRRSTFSTNIETGINSALVELHTMLPGIIQSFDPVEQLADVQISLRRKENGEWVDLSILTGVPVRFFKVGNFSINFPIAEGDEVAVHIIERSIDTWLEQGGIQSPKDLRRHDLSDAYITPQLYSQPNKITDFGTENLQIRNTAGDGFIEVTPAGEIYLNGSTDSAIAFTDMKTAFDQLRTDLNALITAYNTHTHPTAPSGPISVPSSPGTVSAADMSGAEVTTVKVP